MRSEGGRQAAFASLSNPCASNLADRFHLLTRPSSYEGEAAAFCIRMLVAASGGRARRLFELGSGATVSTSRATCAL
jgi:hypothetical protein